MAKLTDYNGHFCESDYEYAFLAFLEKAGWQYLPGNKIQRKTRRDVLIEDDFKSFLTSQNPDLTEDEVNQIYDNIRLAGAGANYIFGNKTPLLPVPDVYGRGAECRCFHNSGR